MPTIPLSQKDYREQLPVTFDFSADLGAETVAAFSVAVTVARGVDSAPGTMLQRGASASGGIVTQWIQGGVPGVLYHLVCTLTTSAGRVLVLTGSLPVSA